jgi:lysophospholipid acyltransferase (LPLAT)-like uncharacterized protein
MAPQNADPDPRPAGVATDFPWRASRAKRLQVAAIASIGYPVLALLGSTYRFTVEGLEHLHDAQALGHPIHAFWHGRILPGTIYFKRRGIVVITSENFDGEWIARIITRFGFGTARGSSSRGARKAMRQLIRDVRTHPVAFTLDGPRGPARVAQPGAVWLAKATGNPIIPFHLEADRHWTLRSWDRTQVPKPFARVALVFAPPLIVAADADGDALRASGRQLESALAACERRGLELLCR